MILCSMKVQQLLPLACLLVTSAADLVVNQPSPGEIIPGQSLTVSFTDSGSGVSLDDFESCQLMLCAGGNTFESFLPLLELDNINPSTHKNRQLPYAFSPELGANLQNAYFIKFYCVGPIGNVIYFSDRFSLGVMHGVLPTAIVQAMDTVQGKEGPETISNIFNAPGPNTSNTASEPTQSETVISTATTSVNIEPTNTQSPTISSSTSTPSAGASAGNSNITSSHSTSILSTGAIVGIAVGGAVLIAILVLLIIWIYRRRPRYLPYDPNNSYDYAQPKRDRKRSNKGQTFTSFQEYQDHLRAEAAGHRFPRSVSQYKSGKKSRKNHYSSSLSSLLGISNPNTFREKQSSRSSEVSLSSLFSKHAPSKSPTPSSNTNNNGMTKVYGAKFALPVDINDSAMFAHDGGNAGGGGLHPMRYSGHSGYVNHQQRLEYDDDDD